VVKKTRQRVGTRLVVSMTGGAKPNGENTLCHVHGIPIEVVLNFLFFKLFEVSTGHRRKLASLSAFVGSIRYVECFGRLFSSLI